MQGQEPERTNETHIHSVSNLDAGRILYIGDVRFQYELHRGNVWKCNATQFNNQ
jgi:hypothetical protein